MIVKEYLEEEEEKGKKTAWLECIYLCALFVELNRKTKRVCFASDLGASSPFVILLELPSAPY